VDCDSADQVRLRQIAEEQAALRRVATLVARGAAPEEVFTAVAGEVGGLLAVDYTVLIRSDPGDMITVVGGWTATGSDPAQGSGLTGLRDRIEAVGGTLGVTSPARGGTTLLIKIPV
jgi:hypothetical protein